MRIKTGNKPEQGSIIFKWLPVILWAVVIFTFSSIPQIKVSQFFLWDFITKKIAHISEYAILFTLIFRATKGNYLMSFILTILYSASDEYHQSFIQGRTARFYDLGFDLTGANIASYILWKLRQILPAKPKK